MKVRATRVGFYAGSIRKEGAVFTLETVKAKDSKGKEYTLKPDDQFSDSWMEKVSKPGPKPKESTQQSNNIL